MLRANRYLFGVHRRTIDQNGWRCRLREAAVAYSIDSRWKMTRLSGKNAVFMDKTSIDTVACAGPTPLFSLILIFLPVEKPFAGR